MPCWGSRSSTAAVPPVPERQTAAAAGWAERSFTDTSMPSPSAVAGSGPSQLTSRTVTSDRARSRRGPTTTRGGGPAPAGRRRAPPPPGRGYRRFPAPCGCPHRVMDHPLVAAKHAAVDMDDVARFDRSRGRSFATTLGIVAVGDEADVLAVRLGRDLQTETPGQRAGSPALPRPPSGKRRNPAARAWWRTGNSSGPWRGRCRGAARRPAGQRRGGRNGRVASASAPRSRAVFSRSRNLTRWLQRTQGIGVSSAQIAVGEIVHHVPG